MKPLCLTNALPLATAEPDITELDMRVLRGLVAQAYQVPPTSEFR
jgi:hypothetical protein